jgi:hypothetical protein
MVRTFKMKDRLGLVTGFVAGVLLATLVASTTSAQPNAYTLSRSVIAGGGGHTTSTHNKLTGTIGQPVVGATSGSATTVGIGFWAVGIVIGGRTVYLPFVSRH